MASRRDKIRNAHKEGRVRELVMAGRSSRDIATALRSEGCDVSHETVARFIREEVEDRREAARAVAAQDAQATIPLVTDGLRKLAALAQRRAERTEDDSAAARLIAAGTSALTALHRVTVGEEPAKGASELLDELGDILGRRRRRSG